MASIDPPAIAPAAAAAGDAEWRRQLALIFLPALAIFAVCLTAPTLFADGDTNWHVGAGRWMLAHGAAPRVDPFSYTFAGKPWLADEWGSSVLLALAYGAAGWSGVAILTGFAVALNVAVVAAEIAPRLGTLTVIATLGLLIAVIWPLVLARPHILALPLTAIWLAGLLRARRAGRSPPLWLLAVMALWANLHGSYLFGVGLVGVFGLEAALETPGRRLSTLARWAWFGLAAAASALLTPNGVAGLISPFRKLLMGALADIGEWKPADFTHPTPFEIALIMTLFVALYRGVRMGAVRAGLLLLLLAMALQHQRHESLLAVGAAMLLAEPLARALEPQRAARAPSLWSAPAQEIAAPLLVIALLFAGLIAWRVSRPIVRADNRATPVEALAHVPPALAAQPVLNFYDFGGWLIFKGVRDFIDGRNDMYGDAFVKNYIAVERDADPVAVAATFSRWKIAWTILPPTSKLAALLDRTPGWRRLYSDKYAVVQARSDALAVARH